MDTLVADLVDHSRGARESLGTTRLGQMLSIRTDTSYDPILGRTLPHGCGFMIDGNHHYLPALGPDAFGHTGLGAMTTVFTSASQQMTIAFHVNGLAGQAIRRREQLAELMTPETQESGVQRCSWASSLARVRR